jgi:hypothetical protein
MSERADLSEVPGETYSKGSGMWIENAATYEALAIIGGLVFALIVTVVSGGAGPPAIIVQKTDRSFENSSLLRYSFEASPLSPYNRFLRFEICMATTGNTPQTPVSFSYQVDCLADTTPVRTVRKQIDGLRFSSTPGNETVEIPLFDDHFIKYDNADLSINFTDPDLKAYSGFAVYTVMGSDDHTTFQAYFRFIYSAFEMGGIILLCWRARAFRTWSPELQVTFPLMVLGPLSNNPLYIWRAYRPLSLFALFDAVATPLFHAYAILVAMAMLDYVLNKNAEFRADHVLRWVSVASPIFVCELLSAIGKVVATLGEPSVPPSFLAALLDKCGILLHAAFFGIALYLLIKAVPGLDMTEKFKFFGYALSISILMIHSLVVVVIGGWFRLFTHTVVDWVAPFGAYNMFTILVMYFHWPFGLLEDQPYQDSRVGPAFAYRLDVLEDAEEDGSDSDEEEDDSDSSEEEELEVTKGK